MWQIVLQECWDKCQTLAHLDLSCTAVGALVPRDVGNKEVFVPYGETLWKEGGAGVVAILARGLMQRPCPQLTEINISFNQIRPVGTESLAGVLGQCAALVKLDLYYNDIRTRGTERNLNGTIEFNFKIRNFQC